MQFNILEMPSLNTKKRPYDLINPKIPIKSSNLPKSNSLPYQNWHNYKA